MFYYKNYIYSCITTQRRDAFDKQNQLDNPLCMDILYDICLSNKFCPENTFPDMKEQCSDFHHDMDFLDLVIDIGILLDRVGCFWHRMSELEDIGLRF